MAVDRRKLIRNAERLVSRGRLDAAIGEYLKVLDRHPDDTTTLNRVGDLYARLKRLEEAIELFGRAAQHFSEQGFFEKAIAIYKKILRFDPHQREISEQLADLQARHGLINEARRNYRALAEGHLRDNALRPATVVLKKLVDTEPEDPGHRLQLAEVLKRRNEIPDAMMQYRAIAELLLTHGKAEEAVRVGREGLQLDPSDLDFISGVVDELRSAGHHPEADLFLEQAAEKNPQVRDLPRPEAAPGAEPSAEAAGEVIEAEAAELEAEPALEAGPLLEEPEPSAELIEAASSVIPSAELEEQEDETAAYELDLEEVEDLEFDIELGDIESPPPPLEPVPQAAEAEAIEPAAEEIAAAAPVEEAEAVAPVEEAEAGASVEELEEVAPVEEAEAAAPVEELEAEDETLRELLIEADVLARYGLEDKAIEKLEEIIALQPSHLDAHRRLITLNLERQELQAAAALAQTVSRLALEQHRPAEWESLRDQLLAEGFLLEGELVQPPPSRKEEPAAEEPTPEEIAADRLIAEQLAATAREVVPEQTGDLSWLDQVTAAEPSAESADVEAFEAEEEFFDLASELERELGDQESLLADDLTIAPEEQTLEEIVEGFRRGMAETLSSEDYDTHYNLGIAYREMGLVDEAISEFQLAAKDPRYLVDCCSLLAACFMEKGFPELAIKWYQQGLGSPSITEEESLGLVYELGNLYLAIGEIEEARQRFVEIYGVNSSYRDVSSKLAELDRT